jgi:hypothetical protein
MEPFDVPDEAISHLPLIINKKIHEYRKARARVFALLWVPFLPGPNITSLANTWS